MGGIDRMERGERLASIGGARGAEGITPKDVMAEERMVYSLL